jgi:dephospho-CoA kinase
MQREGISEEYARARVSAQKQEEWYRSRCSKVLVNDCDLQTYRSRAKELFADLMK